MLNSRIRSSLNYFIEINILLALFALPFSKSMTELCVILSIISWFAKKIFVERPMAVKIDRMVLASLAAFIIFNLFSIANSQYLRLSIPAFFSKVLKWAILFIAIADTIKTPQQLRRVFITMLFSCGLILADAVCQQYITGIDFLHYPNRYPVFKFHGRPLGTTTFPTASFPFPSDFAAWINVYLFTFLSIGYFCLRKHIKPYRIIIPIFCAGLIFFLFLTTSAGALLGTAFSIIVILIMNIKKLLVPIIIFFIIAILITSLIPYLRTYLKEGILDEALSINDRLIMWSVGWNIFKSHPFIGNGVNTFFEHFKYLRTDEDKRIRGSYAHNCFLQMAADIGLLGLVSFLCFAGLVLYSNIRKTIKDPLRFKNAFIAGLSLGVAAFLVHSFFDTNLYSLNLSALFWISIGIIEGIGSDTGEIQ